MRAHSPQYFITLGLWLAGLLAALLVLTFVDTRVGNVPVYSCPPDCGRPPVGLPAATNPVFVAPDGAFSVAYPPAGAAYDVRTGADGVTATWTGGDGGVLRLFGRPAEGRDASAVVQQVLAESFPDSAVAYQLPNATLGFEPGYGVVADFSKSAAKPLRAIVIAAVKNDLALLAVAEGPYRQFTPEFGPGPPSAANLQIAQDMSKYVNSFSWRGDPPH